MRNSVLLIDTNLLLNYITNREDPYLEQSVEIVRKCAIGECTGYIAPIAKRPTIKRPTTRLPMKSSSFGSSERNAR